MTLYSNILATIGNTPIVKVQQLDTGPCELFIKLESQNPGGSIKDRIALHMVEQAEQSGQLKPGATLVEATAGNTGISLALVALVKGYQCLIVMPDKMSKEKIAHLKALGAKIVLTRSDVDKGHPQYYQDLAETIAKQTPGAFYINQFNNPANVAAHLQSTGPEIWQQMQGKLDAFVAGMGTSGTMTGVGSYLRSVNPNIELVLADPKGSILADYINKGEMGEASPWLVEGIGEDYIPSISDPSVVSQAITVCDHDAFLCARELLVKEGLFGGSSTGTLVHAALSYCRAQTTPKRVLTFVCDTGNKYLSKLYNDVWMRNQGFYATSTHGDLRDLIAYPAAEMISINANETLKTAHKRMQDHNISQLPLWQDDELIGFVTEQSMLAALQTGDFTQQADNALSRDYPCLQASGSLSELQSVLQQEAWVAIQVQQQFYGIITRSDWLNHLHREQSL